MVPYFWNTEDWYEATVEHAPKQECSGEQARKMDGRFSEVVKVLELAASQDTRVLSQAEDQLREWELQPQFYPVLLVIIGLSSESNDLSLRSKLK